jgi:hypothetical protein
MVADEEIEIASTPIGFVECELGLSLYEWQDKAIAPLEFAGYGLPLVQITVLAPNEAGKSSRIVAGASMYFLAVHAKGKVGITTKDSKQLNEQIIPALEAQVNKFKGWRSVKSPYYRITTPEGGVLIAFTTDDANRVEGLHGAPDAPLLWIVDEAKSVEEKIFSGIDRCGYQALIYCSTGGLEIGSFFESHYGNTAADFHAVRAGLIDCPHIAKEKVDRIIKKYGIDNPFTRSAVFGEFMKQSDTDEYCVSLQSLLNCINNPPKHKPGIKAGFCDFGEGVAEHVLAVRDGNKIDIAAAWVEANKDAAAGRFIREFIKAGFTAAKASEQLECDASDKEIWQKLSNAGWTLNRRNFGAPPPPHLKTEYISWGAYAWLEGALGIANNEWILPDDPIFKAQAINRKKGYTGNGRQCVEDKLAMKERGVPSPDRPDGVFGVMTKAEPLITKEVFSVTGWRDHIFDEQGADVVEEMGACAGL